MTNPMSKSGYIADELAERVARICERTRSEELKLLRARPSEKAVESSPEWMAAIQLGAYWQLYNDKNEPTTAGILKWSKRAAGNENYDRASLSVFFRSSFSARTFTTSWVFDGDSAATPIPYGDRKKSQGNDAGSSQL